MGGLHFGRLEAAWHSLNWPMPSCTNADACFQGTPTHNPLQTAHSNQSYDLNHHLQALQGPPNLKEEAGASLPWSFSHFHLHMVAGVGRCCLGFLLTTTVGMGPRILNDGGSPPLPPLPSSPPSTRTTTSDAGATAAAAPTIVPLIQDLRFQILRLVSWVS